MAELADARDLKSLGGNTVPVRPRLAAPEWLPQPERPGEPFSVGITGVEPLGLSVEKPGRGESPTRPGHGAAPLYLRTTLIRWRI